MKTIAAIFLAVIGCAPLTAQTEFLKPEGLAPSPSYSHVVVASPGKMIFIAGQVANDKQGKVVGKDDLKAQATQVFENLKTALAAAGATFNDVVKINWYVKGYKPEYLPTLREVRSAYVNKDKPPASTLVGVAALFQDDYLLEVDAIAVVPEKHHRKK
ncbi:MAG: RidA family protein [Acidobacteriia bacterium]|nr:RidA family protein [Terriglobia bacterium]